MLTTRLAEWLRTLPADQPWMHAYTYSGHAVACAVALKNIEIIEREGLVERAAEMGSRLLDGLRTLESHSSVGEVRGLGLMCGVELVSDKSTRASYPASDRIGPKVLNAARERGLLLRNRGDVLCLAPPLVVTAEQIDRIVDIVGISIRIATGQD